MDFMKNLVFDALDHPFEFFFDMTTSLIWLAASFVKSTKVGA